MKKIWEKYSYVIILVAFSYLTIFFLFNPFESKDDFLHVTIQEGDSLWKLAENYKDQHSLSSKEFVHWVEKNNGISGDSIFPGDEIVLPVQIEHEQHSDAIVLAGQ